MVNGPNAWRALACSIARIAPFCVGMPIEASAPLTGRSMPIRIVPELAPAPDAVAPPVDRDAGCEQWASAMMPSAASDARRTAPRNDLARPAPPFGFRRSDTPIGEASL
jgi:hypothetical protein